LDDGFDLRVSEEKGEGVFARKSLKKTGEESLSCFTGRRK